MAKDKHVESNTMIQFRTGRTLGKKVIDWGKNWGVTKNEAARRLVVLAACRLTPDHYQLVEVLANALTGGDFAIACDQLLVALDVRESTLQELRRPPMNEQERANFLSGWVKDFLRRAGKQAAPDAGQALFSDPPWRDIAKEDC
jgi:hypothetical protein